MPSQITTFQCPRCTGPLHFQNGKLCCDYCGSVFDVQEIEERMQSAQASAEEAFRARETEKSASRGTLDGSWDTSHMNSSWDSDARNLLVYSCPSCGAELLCDASTAATSCPYCNNPAIVPGQFSDMLRPDFVIPFQVNKDAAVAAMRKHYQGKPFLPSAFLAGNHIQEVKGIYVPFWLFDGTADADVQFDATRSSTRRESKYEVITTSHYRVRRAGSVAFEKIPVDASSKIPDDLMDSIEPYEYAAFQPFSTAYLPGFLADRYDVSIQESLPRAEERCVNSILRTLENTISGYEHCSCVSRSVSLHRGAVHYALLPVWLLNTRWNGKNFLFAMNGQTGKFVGDLPVSWKKFVLTFFAIAAPLAAAIAAYLYL